MAVFFSIEGEKLFGQSSFNPYRVVHKKSYESRFAGDPIEKRV
jgi:hypothetical protein